MIFVGTRDFTVKSSRYWLILTWLTVISDHHINVAFHLQILMAVNNTLCPIYLELAISVKFGIFLKKKRPCCFCYNTNNLCVIPFLVQRILFCFFSSQIVI